MPLCIDCHDTIHRRLEEGIASAIERAVRDMTEGGAW